MKNPDLFHKKGICLKVRRWHYLILKGLLVNIVMVEKCLIMSFSVIRNSPKLSFKFTTLWRHLMFGIDLCYILAINK